MKALKTAILLTALLSSDLALATSCNGGSCTGGGNVLNKFLIEEYAKEMKDLPHAQETEQYLKLIEERVPAFGEQLRSYTQRDLEDAKGVQFYLIPQKARELPASVTGLQFKTDQVAYQFGKEIFVSEVDAKEQSPDLMGRFYFRELAEMAHPTKDSESVRKLMIYLKANNFAPPQANLVNMLSQLGFGDFLPATLENERREAAQSFQKEREKVFIRVGDETCNSSIHGPFNRYVYPSAGLEILRSSYMKAYGVEGSFRTMRTLDPKNAPQLREHVIQLRNQRLLNERFASFHASLRMIDAKADIGAMLAKESKWNPVDVDGAYWYGGYASRLAYIGDESKMKSTLSFPVKEKIASYQKMYSDRSKREKLKQACADFEVMKAVLSGSGPSAERSVPTTEKSTGGSTAQ